MTLEQLVQRVAVDRPRLLAALREWAHQNHAPPAPPRLAPRAPVRRCPPNEGHRWDLTGHCGRCPAIRCNAIIRHTTDAHAPARCALARETCRYHQAKGKP
jgi:hypothetical protein